jgi:hypothetical protein
VTDSFVINDYAKRVEETVDRNYWLGTLFWYSFGGMRVPHRDLVQMIVDAGLDPSTAPREPGDADVFRRVASSVLKDYDKVKDPNDPDVVSRYGFEEFHDEDRIIKRVTRVRVDSGAQDVGLVELGNIVFERDTRSITYEDFGMDTSFTAPITESVVRDVQSGFDGWRGCLDINGIRSWFRRQIEEDIGAFVVRSGGVIWFALERHRDKIEGLERVAGLLRDGKYGDIEFHAIPLINDEKQRERVREAYEAETAQELERLREIAVAYKKDDTSKLTKDKLASMWEDYHRLAERTREHEEILESTLRVTTGRLDIFKRTLRTLQGQVKP